ncbi:MAG: UDP-N-acetylmuramate--L-alanine ligase [Flavobacteriales bacterium]
MQYYFIGIGGIGMSALARHLFDQGHEVWGYDKTDSHLIHTLQDLGLSITTESAEEAVLKHFNTWMLLNQNTESWIIRTPAVPNEFRLLQAAMSSGIPILKRSELLGQLTRNAATLAVAGTHGKTTTSAMLAWIMKGEPRGCTAFIGGVLRSEQSNVISSKNAEWTVVEADEFDRSFLQLHPTHAAITSVDPDHLDIYGDSHAFIEGFRDFANLVEGDRWLEHRVELSGINGFRYGIAANSDELETLDLAAYGVKLNNGWLEADVHFEGTVHQNVRFPMPGNHNILNALAAIGLAISAGVEVQQCIQRLESFQGIHRRFSYQIRSEHGIFIDDYAHHPQELEAAISAARMHHPEKKITGIFQPHLYSRTRDNLEGFARILSQLDRIFILPIYAAREESIPGIDSQRLFENITNPSKHLIESHQIFDNLKEFPPEVLMTLGAGDIDRCVQPLTDWLLEDPGKRFYSTT